MKAAVIDGAYGAGWRALRYVPERVARSSFDVIADQTWTRRGSGIVMLENNLRRFRPEVTQAELRELSRTAMRSYMRYWCETFRLPAYSEAEVNERVHVANKETLFDGIDRGKGVVIALPHAGNWDLVGAWLAHTSGPFTTVAERLEPASLFDRFVAYRESLGMEVLPLTGDAAMFSTLTRRLRDGGVVCLLADRDLGGSGVKVSFMGESAHMPPGPAALAAATGAMLVTVDLWYDQERLQVKINDAVPIPDIADRRARMQAMTQLVADDFARGITANPQDWHMLQPFWDVDIAARRDEEGAA